MTFIASYTEKEYFGQMVPIGTIFQHLHIIRDNINRMKEKTKIKEENVKASTVKGKF